MKTQSSKSKTKQIFNAGIPLADPEGRVIHLRWRILFTILLTILLILLTLIADPFNRAEAAPAQVQLAQSLSSPTVVAFYYTWFDEATWTADQLSDFPTQSYVSRDRATMGRHIDLAKQAGIDAFLVAWYGPAGEFNQTEENLKALLDEAAARDFKIGILFETNSPFFAGVGDVTNALSHALSAHANHPAFLRADGRPVIFFWRPTIYGVDTWGSIRSQVDPGYGSLWIAEGVDTSYLSFFDGHHLYSNTWNPPANLTAVNQKFANQVAQYGGTKTWVATVMPGYNDIRIRGSSGFAQDREGGAYYDRSWQAAIASNPSWIVINSFNEWPEGSYIEPSTTYGDQFIQQTARWSQQFKGGGGNVVTSVPVAPQVAGPEGATTAEGTQDSQSSTNGFGAKVAVSLLNLRSSPSTASEILSYLPLDTGLTILSEQTEWLEVQVNGQSGWVYASMVSKSDALAPATASTAVAPSTRLALAGTGATPAAGTTLSVGVSLLNLRSGPSLDTTIIAQLPLGHPVIIEDPSAEHPEWIQVRVTESPLSSADELEGWVYASMVQ